MRNSLFAATEWITRFAYVNLLWVAFTLVGLGIFGIFPATVSMLTLIRQWIMGNTEDPIFLTFWKTYKKEFLKSNLIGLFYYFAAILFFVNLQYIDMNQGGFHEIIKIPLYVVMLAISLTALYVIPTFVHYELRFFLVFKNAFLYMTLHPLHNIAMVIGSAVVIYAMFLVPATIIFFGGSIVAYIIMGTCYHAFKKIEAKKEAIEKVD